MEILNKTRNQYQAAKILAVIVGCLLLIAANYLLFAGINPVSDLNAVAKLKALGSVAFAYALAYLVLVKAHYTRKIQALERALNAAYRTNVRSMPIVRGTAHYGRFVKDDTGKIHYLRETR